MAQKFVVLDGDKMKTKEASITSAGAGDSGKIVALNADGEIDPTMLPGAEATTFTADEALTATNFVNIYDAGGGTMKVRKADATTDGKPANGYVKANVSDEAAATVYWGNVLNGFTGLTPAAKYFLDAATPGAITDTPPTATGSVWQYLGKAISDTALLVEIGEPITNA